MPTTKRLKVGDGREVEGVEVDFNIRREDWNEYELADGGRVRMKLTLQRIYRVLDEDGKPARNPDGEPLYVAQTVNQLVATE